MKFNFANIIEEGKVMNNGDTIFVPPYFLHQAFDDRYQFSRTDFYATYGRISTMYGKYYDATHFYGGNGGFYNIVEGRFKALKAGIVFHDILQYANSTTHAATIKPTDEETRALVALLKIIKPKKDTKVFLSQVFLDKESGYDGYSIYLGFGRIGLGYNNQYAFTEIQPDTDYASVFMAFDPRYKDGMPIRPESYKDLVKKAIEPGYKMAKRRVDEERRRLEADVRSYTNAIRQHKAEYHTFVKTNKAFEEEKKRLSPEMQKLLEKGFSAVRMRADAVKSYAASCHTVMKRKMEVDNNYAFMKSSHKKAGSDFKAIKNLIKKGIIETISYKAGEGINWVYSPMVYEYDRGYKAFLGRIKVTLKEVDDGYLPFKIHMISYPMDVSGAATWHYNNTTAGQNFCLGQFEPVLLNLAAQGKISDLIMVFRDYLLSVNPNSKLIRSPRWDIMSMDNPKVIDDSFKVWKTKEDAKNAKIKQEAEVAIEGAKA